jgi:tRNA(Ile)-lysidine synthase
MFEEFLAFNREHHLFEEDDRVLLAVSGGIDSVVMLDLFMKTSITAGIAHCNFLLRDEESETDELFVKNLASTYHVPFYSIRFNTAEYAESKGISVQMAARELRYEWFENTRSLYGYQSIALAHNKNDQVETFLLNITRGTGIRGLTGIKPLLGHLIRPVLFASRKDIEQYAVKEKLHYREDSSNLTTKYTRNRIRHIILPEFNQMNPTFENTIIETMGRLKDVEQIYLRTIEEKKKELMTHEGDFCKIDIGKLKLLEPARTYLFEFLREFGFSLQQIDDIIASLDAGPGKQFISATHRLVRDRDSLIISELKNDDPGQIYYIEEDMREMNEPLRLRIKSRDTTGEELISTDPDIACFDTDQVLYPLIVRRWRQGDYFYPFGMNAMKKLSDFFVDQKFSLFDKENTWLLVSGNKIMWVIGKRIDHRFRVSSRTRRILEIRRLTSDQAH